MPINGANIPPELFNNILTVLDNVRSNMMKPGRATGFVAANKRELGRCSLVNRYWAKLCQPRIFRNITVRSAEDVYTLLSFMEHPISRIANYIVVITVAPIKPGMPPWIHLLPAIYPKIPKQWWFMSVEIEGPFPASYGPIRSIHRTPRTLPTFSQNIDELILRNIAFRRFRDLISLIDELRQLTKFRGTALTWPADTEAQPGGVAERVNIPALPRRRIRVRFSGVWMTECTVDWYALWLMAGYSKIDDPALAEDDWAALVPLVRALEVGLPSKCTARTLRVEDSVSPSAQYSGMLGDVPHRTPCLTSICSVKPGSQFRAIQSLSVDFVHGLDPDPRIDFEDALKCDWRGFHEHFTHLRSVRKVVFGFQTKDNMDHFFQDIVSPDMSTLLLNARVKVVYAVWKHQPDVGMYDGTWQYATPNSDTIKESGADFLDELES